MFANTDVRINGDKKVTPAFIFAALLWFPLLERCQLLMQRDQLPHFEALAAAMNQILSENAQHVAVPKRFTLGARDIWHIQHRFDKRGGQRAYRLSQQPRFKAAYDFMLLLVDSGQEDLKELADWWSAYLNADVNGQKMMVKALGGNNRPRRRRRSGGSRNRNKPKGESQ